MLHKPDRLWSIFAFNSGLLWHRDATASAKKRAKKKKTGPSYKEMMAGVIETGKTQAELRAELALKSSSPVKLAQASQTATYSELLMYIGLSLLLFAFALRRKVLL